MAGPLPDSAQVADESLLALLDAQLAARHLDLYARVLQAKGEGFYTIGSLGHEANAAVAMALRPSDPALLHYRSAGFYCARAAQVPGHDPVREVLLSLMSSADDPISGGRHKVFGNADLSIIPTTSTIASHLPRAVGLAFALDRGTRLGLTRLRPYAWPADALVVASIGDASLNHSTAAGALNSASHAVHQGVPIPLLVVVEDNGLGISVRSPAGWVEQRLATLPGFAVFAADGADPAGTLQAATEAAAHVREQRRPAVLHLRTVRLLGHAGSDAEIAYRTQREIDADHERDPVVATAALVLQRGLRTVTEVADQYAEVAEHVADTASSLLPVRRLSTAAEVAEPLHRRDPDAVLAAALRVGEGRAAAFRGKLPEEAGALTLAQSLTAALTDLLAAQPGAVVFGEDVGAKGGVYGVTRGLQRAFGRARVFDTLLDEQAVLGTALGAAVAGLLPVPEIQYLAYVHNAIDQLRGEAATLSFFSAGQFRNGMVVRVPGLAYQRGFGGHFHNDNSLAALLDIPGLVVAVPSGAAEAPGIVRLLAGLAAGEGRPCVLIEPIALYHSRDLLHDADGGALARYPAPEHWGRSLPSRDEGRLHVLGESAADTLVVTFGNGVRMSQRAIARAGVRADVYDLRWLAPLPTEHLVMVARGYAAVLVVDETRRSGGVSERVVTALIDSGYVGRIQRVTSEDSIIPLGPAAASVLLSEEQIVAALRGPGHG
ncbi:MAG: thiamine pyrophosphate-dependent enzyme [Actinomycetia bacterium]|nr:thiamine pyrophosphate-dependent enzyme [Actinomycetes bacterium]